MVQLGYRYRAYPTSDQRRLLAQTFGCIRVVFNDAVRYRREALEAGQAYPKMGELSRRLTEAKKTPERAWLSEVSAVALQQALGDVNTAYQYYFDSKAGRRKGRSIRAPRFKSKKDKHQSLRLTTNGFRLLVDGTLRLYRIGDLKVRWTRDLPSAPTSVTVTMNAAGHYHVAFTVEKEEVHLPRVDDEVGIDLGLTTFAVLSSGERLNNPRFAEHGHRKIRRAQKSLARKKEGSKNRTKARLRLAKHHARVRDQRRDWLHKRSTAIIRDNQAVFVETLLASALMKTRLARSVLDVSWALFIEMLEYKAVLHGREFRKIDR